MVNTEGSRNLSQQLTIRKYIVRVLSVRQVEILVGSLLGDGYIHPHGKICFEHSSVQHDYLLWKYAELQNFAYPKIATVNRLDKRNGHYSHSYRFFLKQYFQSWRSAWYPQDTKSLPDNFESWFTPLSLAVWYMDDGHLGKGKSPLFASENFTLTDLSRIQKVLEDWHIITSITKNNRMRVLQNSTPHFMRLISPHIVASMRYKVLDPVTT